MPRCSRVHLDGVALHIAPRGHHRAACCFAEEDDHTYLHWLGHLPSHGFNGKNAHRVGGTDVSDPAHAGQWHDECWHRWTLDPHPLGRRGDGVK